MVKIPFKFLDPDRGLD